MGGENDLTEPIMELMPGSSPRGRGKLDEAKRGKLACGLIPAWAGKTAPLYIGNGWPWAHPRVGGENAGLTCIPTQRAGSSPRGRGKPPRAAPLETDTRLIPAWAGKTLKTGLCFMSAGAHPRVGGENPLTKLSPP